MTALFFNVASYSCYFTTNRGIYEILKPIDLPDEKNFDILYTPPFDGDRRMYGKNNKEDVRNEALGRCGC